MEDNPQVYLDEFLTRIIDSQSFQDNIDNLILVGGFAMGYWFNRYSNNLSALESDVKLAVQSDDIDFIGTKEASELIHEELKASLESDPFLSDKIEKVSFADPDPLSSTPNTAIIAIYVKGVEKPFIIDFLGDIKGMDKRSLKRPPRVNDDGYEVRILSPVQILRSRLANLYGLGYGQDKIDREVKRIKVCIMLCHEYINELLVDGKVKDARTAFQMVYQIAESQNGVTFFGENGIAVERHLKPDDRLGEGFIEKELPALRQRVAKSREAYFNRVRNNKKTPSLP